MLHIVSQSPFRHSCLADCLRVCDAQAALLLIEDGVYAALAGSEWPQRIFATTDRVYALTADIEARGLADRLDAAIVAVDYAGFVQLCCEYDSTHSWF